MARDTNQLPRRLYNPFPHPPAAIQFTGGHIHFNPTSLPSSTLAAGKHFLLSWNSTLGVLAVHHRVQPSRALWATPRHGSSFISAALGHSTVHECHGSFTLEDRSQLLFSHQSIEAITITGSQSGSESQNAAVETCSDSASICLGRGKATGEGKKLDREEDPDGTVLEDGDGAVVVVSGCLYSTGKLAKDELWRFNNGNRREEAESPFYEEGDDDNGRRDEAHDGVHDHGARDGARAGVRYRMIFCEKRENQLGFRVELDAPVKKRADRNEIRRIDVRAITEGRWTKHSMASARSWRSQGHRGWRSGRVGCEISDEDVEQVTVPRLNRVMVTYASHAGERFFGFGEQFSCFDLKGKRVPILVQEQGLGRGDQPITAAANLVAYRAGGDWHTTYAPSPHYLTSDMNSLFLENYEHSVFDLTQRDCVQLQVHAEGMKGRILYGQTPPELIKEYTAAVGRMRALPVWITKGAIVGMQGGHDAVREVWRKVKEYDVPLAAFWLQDWVGQRKTSIGLQLWWNWELDRDHYPGWERLVTDLNSQGVKTMTYLNPFITSTAQKSAEKSNRRDDLFAVALKEGYVVPDTCGAPYMLPITSFDAAMLDLTNPETRQWFKRLMHAMVASGVRGWMADFGESLPFDACLHTGEAAATAHNKYPEIWAQLNREFVEEWEQAQRNTRNRNRIRDSKDAAQETEKVNRNETNCDETQDPNRDRIQDSNREGAQDLNRDGADGDVTQDLNCDGAHSDEADCEEAEEELVFFVRAGYRGSPRWATLFWEGDQMVSWQRNDGIKSAVTGLLSSGVSGFAFNHSDIGGYCTVDLPLVRYRRSEELLLRWMELNAFSVIFRSHEGNVPSANAQLYSNDTTLRHFARCAKIYKAWEFYRRQLVKEAASVGMPVVRHLFLHYPEDQHIQTITYQQFLVGTEILVVPVLDRGYTEVQAYFPGGDVWESVWTGNLHQAPTKHGLKVWVQAPLGFPAVFVKRGSRIGQRFIDNLVTEKLKNEVAS